jgi:DNA polymerase-1
MGHKNGEVLVPEEAGDGTTVPPPGYRKVLQSGKESMAKAKYRIPAQFSPPPEQLTRSDVFDVLRPVFLDDSITKIGHNIKFDARSVAKYIGQIPNGPFVDTMIMQFVLDENLMTYKLEALIANNFDGHDAYRGEKLGSRIDTVSFSSACNYVHLDVRWTWMLYKRMLPKITSSESLSTAFSLDMDVIEALMHMEHTGIEVDADRMRALGVELDHRKQSVLIDIGKYAYKGFNPDSNKDKQALLFTPKDDGGLGLKPVRVSEKTNAPSVDEQSLSALKQKHPIVPLLMEWQEITKLKGTYVDGLLPRLRSGRLHPDFNLHRAKTSRLSASNPNLQNIPRESSLRELFVASEGEVFIDADYDQIELRVFCMYSKDPVMSRYFIDGIDIHKGAAAAVFNKSVEDVTKDERQIGKMVNFLTGFDGGAQKLADSAGVSISDARKFIDQYYRKFHVLAAWKEDVRASARKKGYVETLAGHRRRLPDIMSSNAELRSRAERQAVNSKIQGSAADICKEAMVAVHKAFSGTDARLLVQVHDELICAVPKDSAHEYMEVLKTAMGHGVEINGIPLVVSAAIGPSWAEAKE